VVAEVVNVLESFYEVPRPKVADLVRAIIAFPTVVVLDPAVLLRSLELHEVDRLDFAEAYLVVQAERSGIGMVASFDMPSTGARAVAGPATCLAGPGQDLDKLAAVGGRPGRPQRRRRRAAGRATHPAHIDGGRV
jgi:hypothetical protein